MNQKQKTIITALLIAVYALISGSPIYASPQLTFSQPPLFVITSIGEFIGGVGSLLFLIAGSLFFLYLMWGSIEYLTSGGDQGNIESAKSKITAALIGLALVSLTLAISLLVQWFFGVTIFSNDNSILPRGFI